jgi:hypothetical protein
MSLPISMQMGANVLLFQMYLSLKDLRYNLHELGHSQKFPTIWYISTSGVV